MIVHCTLYIVHDHLMFDCTVMRHIPRLQVAEEALRLLYELDLQHSGGKGILWHEYSIFLHGGFCGVYIQRNINVIQNMTRYDFVPHLLLIGGCRKARTPQNHSSWCLFIGWVCWQPRPAIPMGLAGLGAAFGRQGHSNWSWESAEETWEHAKVYSKSGGFLPSP